MTENDTECGRLREQLDALATSLEQSVARNKQGPDMGWTHPDEPADQLRREVGYVIEVARAALGIEGEPPPARERPDARRRCNPTGFNPTASSATWCQCCGAPLGVEGK